MRRKGAVSNGAGTSLVTTTVLVSKKRKDQEVQSKLHAGCSKLSKCPRPNLGTAVGGVMLVSLSPGHFFLRGFFCCFVCFTFTADFAAKENIDSCREKK